MNQKVTGIILIIIGILLASTIFVIKHNEDKLIEKIIAQEGTCFLTDGTCLHADRNLEYYTLGWIISGVLVVIGVYFLTIAKTQEIATQHQVKVSSALAEAKKAEKEKDEFSAFIAGFSKEEQLILKAVKEQDGIKQSTLRYRTGMSKATLSLTLKSLEEREIVSRKKAGKTNQVFLRKKY